MIPGSTARSYARRTRVSTVRRRVAITAAALTIAVWCVIFLRLVAGDDPTLSAEAAPAKPRSDEHRGSILEALVPELLGEDSESDSESGLPSVSTRQS